MLERVEDAVVELATALGVAERVAPADPLEMLPVLGETAARLDKIMETTVRRAVLQGASWDELGTALGLDADTVRERFYPHGKPIARRPVDGPHP